MAILAELLGRSASARRVLALLVSVPGQELHTREIARRVDADVHSVQLALTHLMNAGVIASRRVGPLRAWCAATSSEKLRSVRDLLRREGDVVRLLSEGVSEMPEVRLALVFGSFASGRDTVGSDIDVLIVGQVDWDRIARLGQAVSATVRREVNFVVWTQEEFEHRSPGPRRLLESVLRRPRILLKGNESELTGVAGRRVAAKVRARREPERPRHRLGPPETSPRTGPPRARGDAPPGRAVRPVAHGLRARARRMR